MRTNAAGRWTVGRLLRKAEDRYYELGLRKVEQERGNRSNLWGGPEKGMKSGASCVW